MRFRNAINYRGNYDAEVLVITDVPGQRTFETGAVMPDGVMSEFIAGAAAQGLNGKNTAFVTPCPPLPEQIKDSDKRKSQFLMEYRDEFIECLQNFQNVKLVIYLGKLAGHQLTGSPVKITQQRGSFKVFGGTWFALDKATTVLPMYSPAHVLTRPENREVFQADFQLIGALKKAKWDLEKYDANKLGGKYEWVEDIEHLVKNPPPLIVGDTETRGLDWQRNPGILTVQLGWEEGKGICLPWDRSYYTGISEKQLVRLKGQTKKIMENRKIKKVGHNFKYDMHMLENDGIKVTNWVADTIQMAWAVDENMDNFGLDFCVRRWVPAMATYSDNFQAGGWYSRMWECPLDQMLDYSVGDVDATFRLFHTLKELLEKDKRQMNCFQLVQMPALAMFQRMERNGIRMNKEELGKLGKKLEDRTTELHRELVRGLPKKVKRKWFEIFNGQFAFNNQKFMQDVFFGKDGFNFTPVVFTKTTKRLDQEDKVPSVSTKQHLPYFTDEQFVVDFIEYTKIQKMRSTYVGRPMHEVIAPVELTASGTYPAGVRGALEEAGIRIGRRLEARGGLRSKKPDDIIELGKDRFLQVTHDGKVFKGHRVQAKGFFQHFCGPQGDRIFPSFYLHGTVTGRSSSRNPNAQNYPKHGSLAKEFRKAFRPTDGFSFLEADLSQIELRIAAWMSNDPTMLRVFKSGGDIHKTTACIIMGLTERQFDALPEDQRDYKRFLAKAVNFGFVYGQQAKGFRSYARVTYGISMTLEEATTFRDRFFEKYHYLLAWHKGVESFVKKHGYVRALHGAIRRVPNVGSDDKWVVLDAIRQSINAPVQKFGSDLGVSAMIRYGEDCPWNETRPLAFIHDALQAEAIKGKEMEYGANLLYYMQSTPLKDWFDIESPIPLVADVCVGYDNLGEITKLKGLKPIKPAWCMD